VITPSVVNLVLVLSLTSWAIFARVTRAMTLSLREREFVQVAHTLGASASWTLRRHILPHVVGKVVILGSIELGNMIMLEAALSYLGLGVQPPNASWGLMINQAEAHIATNTKLVILPGLAPALVASGAIVFATHNSSEPCALGQADFFDAAANQSRGLGVASSNTL
jgi:peptide/nickel transport system permease protein